MSSHRPPAAARLPLAGVLLLLALSLSALLLAAPPVRAEVSGEAPWLPDGRAYEQVSPQDKSGGDVGGALLSPIFATGFARSLDNGNAVAYISLSGFGGTLSSMLDPEYLSTRTADGWVTHAIVPRGRGITSLNNLILPPYQLIANDLSAGVLGWEDLGRVGGPEAGAGGIAGAVNLYVRSNLASEAGEYRLITEHAPPNIPASEYVATPVAASADFGHIFFEANDALTPGAPPTARSLYEWSTESSFGAGADSSPPTLRLVSVLPGTPGIAAPSAGAGNGRDESFVDVVSGDGSRVFWTDGEGQLYVRERATTTVQLNASQRAVSLGNGSAIFMGATPDGSVAIFADSTALTDEPGDGGGLYAFDVETGKLRDLTPDGGVNPEVQGVLAMSHDGVSVYFVALAALAPGASAGKDNLYLKRDGETVFIATLSSNDSADWSPSPEAHAAEATPDGGHLAFVSTAQLSPYDNTDAHTGEPDSEVYLYDALAHGAPICISCNPSGARPLGASHVVTGWREKEGDERRFISDDGRRVFFDSNDALVPRDTNGVQDVYEYEEGHVYLISSGTSPEISSFADATPSGDDVFFTTRAQLVPTDRDQSSDLYDARVGGGFPLPPPGVQPCNGEACLGPPPPAPTFEGVATADAPEAETAGGHTSAGMTKHKQHKLRRKRRTHRRARARRGRDRIVRPHPTAGRLGRAQELGGAHR